MQHSTTCTLISIALGFGCLGCSSDAGSGHGRVRLFLEAEESILEGLEPGDSLEDIRDGWAVRFDKLLFTIGRVRATSSSEDVTLSERSLYLGDLAVLPEQGFQVLEAESAPAVRYDEVSFDNPIAAGSLELGPRVDPADAQAMQDDGLSVWVSGELTKTDGQSCVDGACQPAPQIRFDWRFPAPTRYLHCGPEDGDLGFAINADGTTSANFTIHGDHWFFNGFPEGTEIVERRAQWIADSDRDRDGETTTEELIATRAAAVFPSRQYNLSGAPEPIRTAYDFAEAQTRTLGHFQGEGECEWEAL